MTRISPLEGTTMVLAKTPRAIRRRRFSPPLQGEGWAGMVSIFCVGRVSIFVAATSHHPHPGLPLEGEGEVRP